MNARYTTFIGIFCIGLLVGFAGDWAAHAQHKAPVLTIRSISGADAAESEGGRAAVSTAATQSTLALQAYRSTIEILSQSNWNYGAGMSDADRRNLALTGVRGMLTSLRDPFTCYLDAAEWQRLVTLTDGEFGGIGAIMEKKGGKLLIVRPVPGGPADKARMKAGDEVIAIDGHLTAHKSLNELSPWVQGPVGTPISIETVRGSQRQTYRLVREDIEPPVVEAWMEDERAKVGRIVLTEFNKKSAAQIDTALKSLKNRGLRALILDLRFNPGGLLDAAVDVTSMFVTRGMRPELNKNVVIVKYADGVEEGLKLRADLQPDAVVPLVVLVNGSSASAAEIVTAALRDYGAATVIGERTYGKGKVQTLFEIDHGREGGMRLTTSLYYPPGRYDISFKQDDMGNRIAGTGGIVPDVTVPPSKSWSEEFADRTNDGQLKAAIALAIGKIAAVKESNKH